MRCIAGGKGEARKQPGRREHKVKMYAWGPKAAEKKVGTKKW